MKCLQEKLNETTNVVDTGPHIILITKLLTAALFNHTTCRFLQIHLHAIPLLHHLPQPVRHQVIARPILQ
jgi:hypothetical protein